MNYADFRSVVLAAAPVAAIVAARVFPLIVPQEVWSSPTRKPCIVFTTRSVQRQVKFCNTDELIQERVDLDCYARDSDTCQLLAAAVRLALIDFRGTVGVTRFGPLHLESETDLDDDEPGLFRRVLTFSIWSRPAP